MAIERYTTHTEIAHDLDELNERIKYLNQRLTGQRELNLLRTIKDLVWLCEKLCQATGQSGGSILEDGHKALRGDY